MTNYLDNLRTYETKLKGYITEDGMSSVLLHLLETIGTPNQYVLDIGALSYAGSNLAPVVDKFGMDFLFIDGNAPTTDERLHRHWITTENIISLLQKHNCATSMDCICIDIDNMDYWILKTILESGYTSNVLVLEFNPIWNNTESVVKPYKASAKKKDEDTKKSSNYGASLLAFQSLLVRYGYRLIHITSSKLFNGPCNNAIFIKNEFDTADIFLDQKMAID